MTNGRDLLGRARGVWVTLTALALLGLVWSVLLMKWTQMRLEEDATASARRLVANVIAPSLEPKDMSQPIDGFRYRQLLADVHKATTSAPLTSVRVVSTQGTIVFATGHGLVGTSDDGLRDLARAVLDQGIRSGTVGHSYRTVVPVQFKGKGSDGVAVIDRPNDQLVAEAKDRWFPWAMRAGIAAFVFFVLFVATRIAHAAATAQRAHRAERDGEDHVAVRLLRAKIGRKDPRAPTPPAPAALPASSGSSPPPFKRRRHDAPSATDLPVYMQPGFRELAEAKRTVEEALAASEQERAVLADRLRSAESELDEARRRLAELGATADR